MTEFADKQITELRKSGKIDEAHALAKQALESEPDNFYLRNAMAWVLYEKIKQAAETVKVGVESNDGSVSGDVSSIEAWLNEYLRLSLPVPDLSLSLILSRLTKPVGRHVTNFMGFIGQVSAKSDDILRDEDNEPYVHDHGASPSLRTKIAREMAAWCQRNNTADDDCVALSLRHLNSARASETETPQNKIWIDYDLSKLQAKVGNTESAIEYAKKTVRQKKDDWWAWHWLGRLYFGRSNEKAIACLCEAIKSPHEEDKIGKLRLDLAALLKHSGDIGGAVTECLSVAKTYEERGWKFPDKLNDAMNADWFDSSLVRPDNEDIYEKYADEAIEITYQKVEEVPANFLRQVKAHETGRSLIVFATKTGAESFQQVLPARVVSECDLAVGDAVFLRVAIDGEHEYTLRCKQRDGDRFDCLAVRDGVLANHSRDGLKAGIYLSDKEETVINELEGQQLADYAIGSGVKVWVSLNQKNQHLECFRAEPMDTVAKLPGLEDFGGILRSTGREFGFVEDTFIPPSLMDPLLIGNLVKGLKVRSFDKTKDQLGWKAIRLEPLSE